MNQKFFSLQNTVTKLSKEDKLQVSNYLAVVDTFSRTTYSSVYVIDYERKEFEYVSQNPLFLCGNTHEQVKEMGYSFYFNHVVKEDLDLLLKINTVGFNFYDRLPIEERLLYTISYDFHLKNKKGKTFLVNQKLTPLFLNSEGKIWKSICIVSLSAKKQSGNITIYKQTDNIKFTYDLENDFWKKEERINLNDREKEILQFSARGFSINQIAETIFVSADTIKFHRKKIFEKLGVSNISEAIFFATNNKLI